MTQAELAFCKVPAQGTQHHKLLLAFQRGIRVTIWNAMTEYGIGALHQRVKELRDMGWPVQRAMVAKNGKQIAEFWMERAS